MKSRRRRRLDGATVGVPMLDVARVVAPVIVVTMPMLVGVCSSRQVLPEWPRLRTVHSTLPGNPAYRVGMQIDSVAGSPEMPSLSSVQQRQVLSILDDSERSGRSVTETVAQIFGLLNENQQAAFLNTRGSKEQPKALG